MSEPLSIQLTPREAWEARAAEKFHADAVSQLANAKQSYMNFLQGILAHRGVPEEHRKNDWAITLNETAVVLVEQVQGEIVDPE